VKIRNATEKDIPDLAVLSRRFVKEISAFGLVALTEGYLKKLDTKLIWVVEDSNRLVGYALCLPHKNDGSFIFTEDDKILRLDEIYLVPESRGEGIGSQLIKIVERYAKTHGYTKLFIYSSVKELDPVLKFYRGNGFKTWAVQFFKEIN